MEHRARKRFGQNFLTDPNTVRRIIDAVRPGPDDTVVEIGPGLGALTEPLLAVLPRLHVVEIDRDLIARLRQRHEPDRLVIHEGDALAFDFGVLGQQLKVVGNLPYNISTPLLFHLAGFAAQVREMTFMLQKEVVMRMVAEPGGGDYGRLSVMLQYRFDMLRLFDVPPGAFRPAPKVTSSIVRMVPKPTEALTARDNVLFPAHLAPGGVRAAGGRADALLDRLGLTARAAALPATLSGGEKQRVAIARALINQPKLVIADEPTGNLDSRSGQDVLMVLHDIARDEGRSVLIVTHDRRVEDVSDRILWLEDGRLRDRKLDMHEWVRDPVCNMAVDSWTSEIFLDHGDRRLHFCSKRCRERFEVDPERYLSHLATHRTALERRTP